MIEQRKNDHIILSVEKNVEFDYKTTFFEYVEFIHNAVPNISLEDVDLSTYFIGYNLEAPIIIAGMTGGTSLAYKINKNLARVAQELGIGIGVGSQRIALEKSEVVESFSVVRKIARDVPVIGNIGASQLVKGLSIDDFNRIGEMIKANAIAIHLNPLQEAVQVEGEPDYTGILERIEYFVKNSSYPIIIKETGAGISKEVAKDLVRIGVSIVDIGGSGGTSFSKIEAYRASDAFFRKIATDFAEWGIPTAASILEVRSVSNNLFLISTGGLRNGIMMAKALRLGADICGVALPMIRAVYTGGFEKALETMKIFIKELRIAVFLTGATNVQSLKKRPIIIYGLLKDWMEQRKIKDI